MSLIHQIFLSLKNIHAAGYIYNDLKPDNLLLDYGSKNLDSIHLIDYGFATKFLDKKEKHVKSGLVDSFRGNFMTASAEHIDF
jgi:serine/threonine protein kinase